MDFAEESFKKHAEWKGKIEVKSKAPVRNKHDLSVAYTPGVATPCLEIQKDYNKSFELKCKRYKRRNEDSSGKGNSVFNT